MAESLSARYACTRARPIDLENLETDVASSISGEKAVAKQRVEELSRRLNNLQDLLYANQTRRILIVLQGMDTSGKDGTVRHVFRHVDPLGVKVFSFRAPNALEKRFDYLWRVHKRVPGAGEITIFNRSHYEDVVITRVHDWISQRQADLRYRHIREFERMLADEGVSILKFFLHISKQEQKQRLQARLDDPNKHWKFDLGDVKERRHWDSYQKAYSKALSETNRDYAPWHVIPSDRKWFRNLIIGEILVETVEQMQLQFPPSKEDLSAVTLE